MGNNSRSRDSRAKRKAQKPHDGGAAFLPKNVPAVLAAETAFRPDPKLPGERHLFVSEGAVTEPLYLQSMVNFIVEHCEEARNRFEIHGEGLNTLGLLKKAEKLAPGFQHIWVIYDKDEFPGDDFDNTVSRCNALTKKSAQNGMKRTFHAIWSNECFEVWLLFHFMFLSAGVPRKEYAEKLSEQMGKKYDKLSPPGFEALSPKLNGAIRNAKRQMENFDAHIPPSKRNPCTNFYELAENLMPYIKAAQEAKRIEEAARRKDKMRMGESETVRRAKNSS